MAHITQEGLPLDIEHQAAQALPEEDQPIILPVIRMCKAFADHPYVRSRRPVANNSRYQHEDVVDAFLDATAHWPLLKGRQEERLLKQQIDRGLECFGRLETSDWTSRDEHGELYEAAVVGTDAYLKFFEGNVRLVAKNIPIYIRIEGTDAESLFSAGLEALPHAITKFDSSKGFKFSTYATWWIRQAMQREVGNNSRLIRVPIHAQEQFARIGKFVHNFSDEHYRQPTQQEIVDEGYSWEVLQAYNRGSFPLSLDMHLDGNSDTELYDVVADKGDEYVKIVDAMTNTATVTQILQNTYLNEKEKIVLSLRFGVQVPGVPDIDELADEYGLDLDVGASSMRVATLGDIGKVLHLTRERVRQIEGILLAKLRRSCQAQGLEF